MSSNSEIGNILAGDCAGRLPNVVFREIRNAFVELGILNQDLSLEHEGVRYRISCDDRMFMVYRVNENTALRHHVPGWPVCLVNSETIFEESCSPGLGDDHYTCGLNIEEWLELIGSRAW
ncbi:MAG: hypothetical protein HY913_09420 [Desulfomonile tiedjei]|nr:hypothetical protein [Desulfomonile tiedjei]